MRIEECTPISKQKNWTVLDRIGAAVLPEVEAPAADKAPVAVKAAPVAKDKKKSAKAPAKTPAKKPAAAKAKKDDIKVKTDDQLATDLAELKREQFNLRFQSATNQLEKPSRVRVVRRSIAQIKTQQTARAATAAQDATTAPRAAKA